MKAVCRVAVCVLFGLLASCFPPGISRLPLNQPNNTILTPDLAGGLQRAMGTPGSLYRSQAYGNYVFTAAVATIKIFERSGLALSYAGEIAVVDARSICIDGDVLYVADDDLGLASFDITDPLHPAALPAVNVGYARDVCVSGGRAYVVTSGNVVIVDLAAHTVLQTVSIAFAGRVAVSGQYMFVTTQHNLAAFNVADPTAVTPLDSIYVGGYAQNLRLEGNYVYAVSANDGLAIVNIADPAHLVIEDSYSVYPREYADAFVSGTLTYLLGRNQLIVLDTSDVTDITLLSETELSNVTANFNGSSRSCIPRLLVVGTVAYLSEIEKGLQIYDVSDSAVPAPAGTVDVSGGDATDIFVNGTTAYLTDTAAGLKVINVSDLSAPVVLSTTGGNARTWVQTVGTIAYCLLDNNLNLVDVADPSASYLRSNFYFANRIGGLDVAGNYCYISHYHGLAVIDVSNPDIPVQVGTTRDLPDGVNTFWEGNVRIQGSYAYVVAGHDGLVVVDVSNPAAPVAVRNINFDDITFSNIDSRQAVAVNGNYAYITDDDDVTLLTVDISNPVYAHIVDAHRLPYYEPYDMALSGNRLYVSILDTGVTVVDVSNPARPFVIGTIMVPARGIEVVGDRLYVAGGSSQYVFSVFQITD